MNRTRAIAAVLFLLEAIFPLAVSAQNLEAGKSPAQLFSNNCADCHRTPRGLLRTVPPGSLPSFLREHYTTSKDMAQQLAGFLVGSGATDPRGRPPEVRQPPQGTSPPQSMQQQQRPPEQEQPRPQRPIDQQQVARPPEPPVAQAARLDPDAKLSRRERRAKRDAERAAAAQKPVAEQDARGKDKNRRGRISPARIDAASERGKDALPLGDAMKGDPAATAAKPETVAPPADAAKPTAVAAPELSGARLDPVPQVTPAPAAPPSATETPRARPAETSDDPPSGSTAPAAAAPEPPAAAPAATPAAPPTPPISN